MTPARPAPPRSALTNLLDLAVFGPVGVAVSLVGQMPEWVEKGREEAFRQLDVARLVGEHASRHGQKRLKGALVGMGILPGPRPPAAAAPGEDPPARAGGSDRETATGSRVDHGRAARGTVAAAAVDGGAPAGPTDAPGASSGRAGDGDRGDHGAAHRGQGGLADRGQGGPAGADLAIPGYDSLSAFQVVQRLAGLAADELESVRRYETAGRGRRTILTRISQLQTGRT